MSNRYQTERERSNRRRRNIKIDSRGFFGEIDPGPSLPTVHLPPATAEEISKAEPGQRRPRLTRYAGTDLGWIGEN